MSRQKLTAALLLALSLPCIFYYPFSREISADSDFKWRRINIPTEGSPGGWALARGSDLKCLTRTTDGTLFVYANPTGTTNRLFKSTNNGASWTYTGGVTAAIVDIAALPDNAAVVYYATTSTVFRSVDSGVTFIELPGNPGGAGAGNVEITAIDVAYNGANRVVAAATKDRDTGQFGGVYILDEGKTFTWQDTGLAGYDAYAVSFAPDYSVSRQLIAVANNEADTYIKVKNGEAGWGTGAGDARIRSDNLTSIPVIAVAAIAFPDNYSADLISGRSALFAAVGTDTGNGDVYKITAAASPGPSTATDLNAGAAAGLANADITSLGVSGNYPNVTLIGGASAGGQVFSSRDNGKNWNASIKSPTGASVTGIIAAPDFAATGLAYAVTSGIESAFSLSRDYGLNWNGLSLIDTLLNPSGLTAFAPSPAYANDRTVFVLASGSKDNIFRTTDAGATWERTTTSATTGIDAVMTVRLPPDYGPENRVVYLTGTGSGLPVIWRSADNGENFNRYGAPYTVDALAVAANNTIIVCGMQAGSAYITISTNGGFVFGTKAVCGTTSIKSIALSPDYEHDKNILAGNSNGWVFLSTDGGVTFKPLPPEASIAPFSGIVSVAFDDGYSDNHIVYAASSTLNTGIYKFTVGKSQSWEKIDTSLPEGSSITQITVSPDGVLYASNQKEGAGMERSVNPTSSTGASFETVASGLPASARLAAITLTGNQVFAIDSFNGCLVTALDPLVKEIALAAPPDKAQGTGMLVNHMVYGIMLDWQSISGVTAYHWQLSPTDDFSYVATGFEGDVGTSQVALPVLNPATTYRWRIRATQPAMSPWSATWSFTTSLGEAVTAPSLNFPAVSATGVPCKPVFHWDAIAGAAGYELVVGTDAGLATPVVSRTGEYAIPGTAWESNVLLDYGTTYYWKVRAMSSSSKSAWSNTGAFKTIEKPVTALPTSNTLSSPLPVGQGDTKPAPVQPPAIEKVDVMPAWGWGVIGGLTLCLILLVVVLIIFLTKVYF